MDAKTILKLVDAGFTKSEIFKLGEPERIDQVPDQIPDEPKKETLPADPKPESHPRGAVNFSASLRKKPR